MATTSTKCSQLPYPGHVTVPSLPILDVALELAGPLPGVLRPSLADGQPALVIIVDSLNSETQSGPLCSPFLGLVIRTYRELLSTAEVVALSPGDVPGIVFPDDVTHLVIVFEGTELEIER